jgi:hypothetical protein
MNASTTPVPGSSPTPRRGGFGRVLLMLLVATVLALAAWTWFSLTWSYSDGDRGGVLQKFSRKGWLCKTYEGELAMYIVAGVAPQIWQFSVRDPQVAEQLGRYVGERVQLHYTEHVGVPTRCFAETAYFVDRVLPAPVPGADDAAPGNPPAGVAPVTAPPPAAPETAPGDAAPRP